MGMEYQKNHAWPNDYILYRHELEEMSKCPRCGVSRYEVKDDKASRYKSLNNNRHLTETSMRAGNSGVYGFLEPQSIQRSGQSQFDSESYIKSWMQTSKRHVYLGAYLNG